MSRLGANSTHDWFSVALKPRLFCLFRCWACFATLTLAATVFGAGRGYLDRIDKLKLGMTSENVVALLGEPDAKSLPSDGGPEVWYYRLATLAQRESKAPIKKNDLLTLAGRLRCKFLAGTLVETAGLWPPPVRPPKRTLRGKVMLVDVSNVYDNIRRTKDFNAAIRAADADETGKIRQLNAEGNALVARYEAARSKSENPKASDQERQSARSEADRLLTEVKSKHAFIEKYVEEKQAEFRERVARQIDTVLPAISEALLRFKTRHGYEFLYETKQTIFSLEQKPLLVPGTDVTDTVIKWIDEGHATEFGL